MTVNGTAVTALIAIQIDKKKRLESASRKAGSISISKNKANPLCNPAYS